MVNCWVSSAGWSRLWTIVQYFEMIIVPWSILYCCTVWSPAPGVRWRCPGGVLSLWLHCVSAQYGVGVWRTSLRPISLLVYHCALQSAITVARRWDQRKFLRAACNSPSEQLVRWYSFSPTESSWRKKSWGFGNVASRLSRPVGQWDSLHILHERGLSLWQDNRDYSKLSLSMLDISFHFPTFRSWRRTLLTGERGAALMNSFSNSLLELSNGWGTVPLYLWSPDINDIPTKTVWYNQWGLKSI